MNHRDRVALIHVHADVAPALGTRHSRTSWERLAVIHAPAARPHPNATRWGFYLNGVNLVAQVLPPGSPEATTTTFPRTFSDSSFIHVTLA